MRKKSLRHSLICVSVSASLVLASCDTPGGNVAVADFIGITPAEIALRDRSKALQKTVIEAIAVGALAGAAIGLLDRTPAGDPYGGLGLGGYLLAGAVVGAVAGSYVAFLQDDFANKEERLVRARADIRANNSEMAATVRVMQTVVANQKSELNRLRAAVAAGTADAADLNREVGEARANLAEIQRATKGAERRQKDFNRARRAVAVDNDSNNIDEELAELSTRISQMRAVADDLAQEL